MGTWQPVLTGVGLLERSVGPDDKRGADRIMCRCRVKTEPVLPTEKRATPDSEGCACRGGLGGDSPVASVGGVVGPGGGPPAWGFPGRGGAGVGFGRAAEV